MCSNVNILTLSVLVLINVIPICYASFTESQLYVLSSKFNFEKGFEECKKQSMSLVKITNAEINKLVYDFAVKGGLKSYFIDGNNTKTETEWVHYDGNKLEFLNFKSGQPDNVDKKEHCINAFDADGTWNDVPCEEEMSIICSSSTSTLTVEQIHVLPTTGSFDTAISLCKEKSMNLIKINDPGTNLLVFNYVRRLGLNLFWIDSTDKVNEGQWCTNDGTALSFTNFRPGQPDNWQNDEHCTNGNRDEPTWNDLPCSYDIAILCYAEKPAA